MNRNPRDIFRLLQKITPRKIVNAARITGSYYSSIRNGNPVISGMPIALSIEPTTSCNLRCPECPSGMRSFTRPTGMLDPGVFRRVIDQVYRDLVYLTFYFQGEPYLHPGFLEMVGYASRKNIYTSTSTNAHFLDRLQAENTVSSGLDRLIISIDGTTQDIYSSYRIGGNLEKVIQGTRNIVKAKKKLKSSTPHLIFQFLVVRHNEHQVEEVKRLAAETGVNELVFKTAQVYDFESGNPLIPENSMYSRYRKLPDGNYVLKNPMKSRCWKLWHSAVITWDGNVLPCCFDKDGQYTMGTLRQNTFGEIWNNDAYKIFRNRLLKDRKQIDICRNCTEGTKVWT